MTKITDWNQTHRSPRSVVLCVCGLETEATKAEEQLAVGSCFGLSTFQLELCKYRGQPCIYSFIILIRKKKWLEIWRFRSDHTLNISNVWGKSRWTLRVVEAEQLCPKHVTELDDIRISQLNWRKRAAPQETVVSCLGSQNIRNRQSQHFRPTLTHGRAKSAWSSASDQFTGHRTFTWCLQINDSCSYQSRNSSILHAFNCKEQCLGSWFNPL